MKTIELTQAQRESIINALTEAHDICDKFSVDVEFDELTVTAEGWVDIRGHVEDDYYCGYDNGTGGFVEDYRVASVTLTAYDENGTAYDVDKESNIIIDKYLNAA